MYVQLPRRRVGVERSYCCLFSTGVLCNDGEVLVSLCVERLLEVDTFYVCTSDVTIIERFLFRERKTG